MPRPPRLLVLGSLVAVVACSLVPAGPLAGQDEAREERGYGGQEDPYAAQSGDALGNLDAFWVAALRDAGVAYRPPPVVPIEGPIRTGCGPADPSDFAFYCPVDEGIYYSVVGFAAHEVRFGDFAPIVVTAHERGHHV